ncbi:winged helix-turn-helix domain-containing protein [Obesumbacterium proteus]|uniref:winged helix-turn-helix domain-containing protein n=1 Tax=Obesumbacterium proteus TaxID=82983 RepID=UPI001F43DECF|nr:winged helix-turn-helix domain-containing protein [Obesumbacterium proteus]MCE9886106.1 winged helix-turn-helix domain-containing protein [Obesumbacterium proteus]MCE9918238.1 winged helix-turn-helix domain-containing protein [Obesumbacterium proteus]MCE9931665.1 winged helix-turn-helix domain-containing protein [Obesumbacterium proteus]MCG2875947.1 winged helix-turn-helix domain-containing protein [Obesumbacterium proteus]
MQYLIYKTIIFETNDGTLKNIESEDSLQLTETATRLFVYLIKNNSEIISREDILTNVWDKYGFQSSNNALTQYISLIRKNCHSLGVVSDVIITIPKIGFQITNEIEIIEENPQKEDISLSTATEKLPNKDKRIYKVGAFFVFACVIMLSVFLFYNKLVNFKNNIYLTINTHSIGNIDTCPIVMLNISPVAISKNHLLFVKRIADSFIPCIESSFFLYSPDDSVIFDGTGKVFLSRCSFIENRLRQKEISGCTDIIVYE